MGKLIDKGAVPPDDPMFSGGPQLHVPMPRSELTKPTKAAGPPDNQDGSAAGQDAPTAKRTAGRPRRTRD
jgi:hypothetical protein